MEKLSPEEEFQLRWIQKHGVNARKDEEEDFPDERPPAGVEQKFRRRAAPELEVDEEMDLHGDDIQTALFKLEQMIERARTHGYRRARIIHGVGTEADYGNSLRLQIKKYLNTRAQGWITSWAYDNPTEGSLIIHFSGTGGGQ